MKIFFLSIEDSDWTKTGDTWVSPILDLYDNSSYRNYCTTRTGYGLNLLGDGTWTGMIKTGVNTTDSGYVDGDRFIDTSGRIDLVSHQMVFNINQSISYKVGVYLSDDLSQFPDDVHTSVFLGQEFNVNDCPRYAKFVVTVSNPLDVDLTAQMFARVEISKPVMAPLYDRTRALIDKFPEWMDIREVESAPATPSLATPESLGGKVINIAAGEWISQLVSDLSYLDFQHFISIADMNQVAWVYRYDYTDSSLGEYGFLVSAIGDGVDIARATDMREFMDADPDDDILWWDYNHNVIFFRKDYTLLTINGLQAATPGSELAPHHVWNWVDDIGASVDLPRIHLETNERFKLRILDVFKNRPSVALELFKRTLRRELDIWRVYGSTPNSDYQGATPIVLEMPDIEVDPTFVDEEGMPTDKFVALVDELSKAYPTTWGRFRFGKAMWDLSGLDYQGYGMLPYRLDATPLLDGDTQSGVGDGSDLYVYRPDVVTGPHEFTADLKVRGRNRSSRTEWPRVYFDVEVQGQADNVYQKNPVNDTWFTVEFTVDDPSPYTVYHSFNLAITSDASAFSATPFVPSPASYGTHRLFDFNGYIDIENTLIEADGTTFTVVYDAATPNIGIHHSAFTDMKLVNGKWDSNTLAYIDVESSDTFSAWFNNASGTKLEYGTPDIPGTLGQSFTVSALSKELLSETDKWYSNKVVYPVGLNGQLPDNTEVSKTITLPSFVWPQTLAATPNKEYAVRVVSSLSGATPVYGGWAFLDTVPPLVSGKPAPLPPSQSSTTEKFIDTSYIYMDGSNAWSFGSNNEQRIPYIEGATPTFMTGVGADATPRYPVEKDYWGLFEYTLLSPMYGVVDQNGPWRNGVPSRSGNLNFNWATLYNLSRADFGMPDDADYVPTWMGVEVTDDPHVLVWLDNNTVNPVDDIYPDITYPANAIDEVKDGSNYLFETFIIKARMRPDPLPQWNPQVHTGWFYDRQKEFYFYAKKADSYITSSTPILPGVARQGAPIIAWTDEATPKPLRQVSFFDKSATPYSLSLSHTERVNGTGASKLFAAFPDIYDITVTEVISGNTIPAVSSTTSNEIVTSSVTDRSIEYDLTFKLRNSFYADNEYLDDDGEYYTKLVFDKSPSQLGVAGYNVNYEASLLNPATPVDLPLNPMYTSLQEGFIFISHNEYTLDAILVNVSPSKIAADGKDYMMITFRSVDKYGNPKPNQTFTLSTDFGVLDEESITTDGEGFAVTILRAGATPPVGSIVGTLTITGGVNTSVSFDIEPMFPDSYRLMAIPSNNAIPADGQSMVTVFGRLEDTEFKPVPNTRVNYRKARSVYELFQKAFDGYVYTDSSGYFEVGPYTAATPAGFWFLGLETNEATPSQFTGDVIFWNEYPLADLAVDELPGITRPPIQMATPPFFWPKYSDEYTFPYGYDDATPGPFPHSATPITINWEPPKWYSLDWYTQYQLGLFGATPDMLSPDYIDNAHYPIKEL